MSFFHLILTHKDNGGVISSANSKFSHLVSKLFTQSRSTTSFRKISENFERFLTDEDIVFECSWRSQGGRIFRKSSRIPKSTIPTSRKGCWYCKTTDSWTHGPTVTFFLFLRKNETKEVSKTQAYTITKQQSFFFFLRPSNSTKTGYSRRSSSAKKGKGKRKSSKGPKNKKKRKKQN